MRQLYYCLAVGLINILSLKAVNPTEITLYSVVDLNDDLDVFEQPAPPEYCVFNIPLHWTTYNNQEGYVITDFHQNSTQKVPFFFYTDVYTLHLISYPPVDAAASTLLPDDIVWFDHFKKIADRKVINLEHLKVKNTDQVKMRLIPFSKKWSILPFQLTVKELEPTKNKNAYIASYAEGKLPLFTFIRTKRKIHYATIMIITLFPLGLFLIFCYALINSKKENKK
ncbi:MAG: hypothetical protein AAF770_02490 [Bacteroidota bacterium]